MALNDIIFYTPLSESVPLKCKITFIHPTEDVISIVVIEGKLKGKKIVVKKGDITEDPNTKPKELHQLTDEELDTLEAKYSEERRLLSVKAGMETRAKARKKGEGGGGGVKKKVIPTITKAGFLEQIEGDPGLVDRVAQGKVRIKG